MKGRYLELALLRYTKQVRAQMEERPILFRELLLCGQDLACFYNRLNIFCRPCSRWFLVLNDSCLIFDKFALPFRGFNEEISFMVNCWPICYGLKFRERQFFSESYKNPTFSSLCQDLNIFRLSDRWTSTEFWWAFTAGWTLANHFSRMKQTNLINFSNFFDIVLQKDAW